MQMKHQPVLVQISATPQSKQTQTYLTKHPYQALPTHSNVSPAPRRS